MDHIENLRRIAAELNNVGVSLQECNRFLEAGDFYHNAMQALKLKGSIHENPASCDLEELERRCEGWNARLTQAQEPVENRIRDSNGQALQDRTPTSYSEAIPIDLSDREMASADGMTLVIVYNMAQVSIQMGSIGKAMQLLDMAVSLMPSEIIIESMIAVVCMAVYYNYGELKYQQDGDDQSTHMLLSAYQLGQQALGDHVLVASTLNVIGRALVEQGHVSDAIELFAESTRIYNQHTVETIKVWCQREEGEVDAAAPAA